MERVQGPFPKQATATHLLSFFSPPSELSPQYPAPPHHSSQALVWNNSSNAHQDLMHTHQHWPPHCTNTGVPSCSDLDWNVLSAAAGVDPASHQLNSAVTPLDAGCPALLLEECVRVAKNRSFPQPVVSVPFSCKLDMAAVKSRSKLLASLSSHIAEDMDSYPGAEDYGPVSGKVGDRPVQGFQGNVKNHQCKGSKSGVEEYADESSVIQVKKEAQKQKEEGGGVQVYNTGDAGIGLKLGKRTYFGDSGVGGSVKASKQVALASNTNNSNCNGGNNACTGNGAGVKKSKTSSSTVNVPRCQAEDCKIDLSGAKDYHRRHKVCEWHSKSSKVKVASMDQRFCQQCSRFHVLSEFDEGKRSCRRRLAGHNERRRKQQPEPFSLLSAASYAYFAGAKHLFSTSLLDRPYFFDHEHARADLEDLKIRKPKDEPVGNYPSLELHHFMQGSQRGDEHLLVGGSAQALVLAGGNGINPPAPLATLAACLVPDHPQPSPETLVSGRALSLLSSSLGFPNPSNSVSTALGVSSPSFEGHLLEKHHATSSHPIMSSASSCFTSNASKPVEILRLSHNHDMNTLPGPESAAVTHCLSMNQVQPSTILSFGGSYTFPILPERDVQSDAEKPVLDLMQVSFAGSHPPRRQVEHQFTDLEGLSMFGRKSLM